jgi:raffinose/stachyose/melibiose transport system substrate-binding protein
MHRSRRRQLRGERDRRKGRFSALLVLLALTVAACAPPGTSDTSTPTTEAEGSSSTASADSTTPTTSTEPSVGTELTEDPVNLVFYIEPNFPYVEELGAEFMKQHPNVTIEYRKDQFANLMENTPRVLASDDPPDIVRLPSLVDLVADNLLLNLDPYFEAFGWDAWPQSILAQDRVDENGSRGSGPLFAVGLGYSVTGVFYNKSLAAQIGMDAPPETLAELDDVLAVAKAAGTQPIIATNTPVAGTALPYQMVLNQYVDKDDLNAWILQQPGATFDTPEAREATEHLVQWIDAGYFQPDVNAIDYTTHIGQFVAGEGLFLFIGDWESANLGSQMGDDVGFFLVPPREAGAGHVAMSAPAAYGIAASSPNADAAAFFLNWVHTDPEARRIIVESSGQTPGGPPDLPVPLKEGTLTAETIAASAVLGKEDGAVDFIANATGAILSSVMTPELQKLFAGEETAQGLVEAIQAEYEAELER